MTQTVSTRAAQARPWGKTRRVAVWLAWSIVVASAVALAGLAIFWFPHLAVDDAPITADATSTTAASVAADRASIRTATLGAMAAFGAGIGLVYTHRNYRHQVATAAAVDDDRRAQAALAQRTFVAERFNDAVKQLADEKSVAVRVAGIYSLESVAEQDPTRRASVRHLLTAFMVGQKVRPSRESAIAELGRRARRSGSPIAQGFAAGFERGQAVGIGPAISRINHVLGAIRAEPLLPDFTPPRDVEAAQIVLARLGWAARKVLVDADLWGADLSHAELTNADLTRARVHQADFSNARLAGAVMANVYGREVRFDAAVLKDADLSKARLPGSSFNRAYLVGVDFSDTKLDGSDFSHAVVKRDQLSEAQRAVIRGNPAWVEEAER